mgnify:CR=1 FL=1
MIMTEEEMDEQIELMQEVTLEEMLYQYGDDGKWLYEQGKADGAREFAEWIHKYLGYSNDVLFTYRQSPVGFVIASKKSVDEIYAEWQKGKVK